MKIEREMQRKKLLLRKIKLKNPQRIKRKNKMQLRRKRQRKNRLIMKIESKM
jgi:hypothetical protein